MNPNATWQGSFLGHTLPPAPVTGYAGANSYGNANGTAYVDPPQHTFARYPPSGQSNSSASEALAPTPAANTGLPPSADSTAANAELPGIGSSSQGGDSGGVFEPAGQGGTAGGFLGGSGDVLGQIMDTLKGWLAVVPPWAWLVLALVAALLLYRKFGHHAHGGHK